MCVSESLLFCIYLSYIRLFFDATIIMANKDFQFSDAVTNLYAMVVLCGMYTSLKTRTERLGETCFIFSAMSRDTLTHTLYLCQRDLLCLGWFDCLLAGLSKKLLMIFILNF